MSPTTGAPVWLQRITRQQWISRSLRRRVADAVFPPSEETFEGQAFGRRYVGRLDSYIDREVFFFGSYEPGVLDLLGRLARHRPNAVLLDVGSNVGQHSLFASGVYKQVHAFEPFPPLVEVLRQLVARNDLMNVHVHAVGLGDTDAESVYRAPADERAGYGGFDNHDPNLKAYQLPLRRGDAYLRGIGVGRVDVVKIDVEGSEARVVAGLTETLSRDRPAIVMEYWPDAWPEGLGAAMPPRYRFWSVPEPRSRGYVFQSRVSDLLPADGCEAGSTILALPEEWPIPAGLNLANGPRTRRT